MRSRSVLHALLVLGCSAGSLASSEVAHAHARSTSTSSWEIRPSARTTARVVVRAPWIDLQAALPEAAASGPPAAGLSPEVAAAIDDYLVAHARLYAAGRLCSPSGPVTAAASADPGHVGRSWGLLCESAGPLEVVFDGLFEVARSHLHLARARVAEAPPVERILVIESKTFPLVTAPERAGEGGSGLGDYVALGAEHILTGVDHLVFLLALLLAGTSLRQVAMIVTGFTAAHSVTLALGVLGFIRPDASAIEALIGLSIVIVAFENFVETVGAPTRRALGLALGCGLAVAIAASLEGRFAVPALALCGIALFTGSYFGLLQVVRRPESLRWFVAFVFGLVHGFGFAGALAETALPAGRVAQALVGFNLGVELGQLAIVALVWPLLRLAFRAAADARPLLIQLGSTPVLAAGLYWFVARAVR